MENILKLHQLYVDSVLPTLLPGCGRHIVTTVKFRDTKLSLELGPEAFKGTRYDTKSKKFVHFTSLKALQSILNESSIRLYCLNNSNDPNEFKYFIKGKESILFENDQIKENTFTFSMCDEKVLRGNNALNLWRLYGDGGRGVAIIFEINLPENDFDKSYLGRVLYTKPDLDAFLQKNREFETENKIKVDYSDIIHVPACYHKNSHYKIEEEIRLMHYYYKGEMFAKYRGGNDKYLKDFNSRNEIVTYSKLNIGKLNKNYPSIYIKEIQIGFRHEEGSFLKIKKHFKLLMASMIKSSSWDVDEMPKISHSNLLEI
ncbi:MAG TPA: hypothetical protein DCF33_20955, partial [Saprospirales bacterium]|nr:hypothetical protein [Saprospirales bacterium]